MRFLYILISFTTFFIIYSASLLPFSKHPKNPKNSSSEEFFSARSSISSCNEDNNNGKLCDCSETCAHGTIDNIGCNLTLPAPKKVINSYRKEIDNLVPPKPFGSFCIKCAACLAVANQLEEIIKNTNKDCEMNEEKQAQHEKELTQKINDLCVKGFRNYDLRLFKNHSIITDTFKCTTHIESKMDGSWTKKLRELCVLYVSRIDIELVSNSVIDTGEELTNKLCRGTGIFRDCSNLESHKNISLPKPSQEENCDCLSDDS